MIISLLRLVLLSILALLVSADRVAIVFTDVKLDDKVAVRILMGSGYQRVVAVISGVRYAKRAHGDLLDFLSGFPRSSLTVLLGVPVFDEINNGMPKVVPHEVNFLGSPTKLNGIYGSEWLRTNLHEGDNVDVFQIAPTPRRHVEMIAEVRGFTVGLYHLVHGYNSQQAGSRDMTLSFLNEIGAKIHSHHPQAKIVFTNNFGSFVPAGSGGSQPFSAVTGLLPKAHLDAAINDPFHTKKLLECAKTLLENGKTIAIPLVPEPYQERYQDSDLSELIFKARTSEPGSDLRQHFLSYLDTAIPILEQLVDSEQVDANLVLRLKNAVRKAFVDPLSVELCDANHIVAVLDAIHNSDETQFYPMVFKENPVKKVVEFADLHASEEACGLTLHGLSPAESLRLMKSSLKISQNALPSRARFLGGAPRSARFLVGAPRSARFLVGTPRSVQRMMIGHRW